MKHYLDSSVVLALLLEGDESLKSLEGKTRVASSRLLWVEVSRVFHRGLQTGQLDALAATRARHSFVRFVAGLDQILITEAVLDRAAGPYPLTIRTLDAMHLASAELWLTDSKPSDAASFGEPAELSIWSLDRKMNLCAAQLGFCTPLLDAAV